MRNLLAKNMSTKKAIMLSVLVIIVLMLPLFLGVKNLTVVSRIFIFAVYAMAYDILRGYTGFINLGFALFLGGGAYFVGIMFAQVSSSIPMLLLAIVGTIIYCVIWALIIGKVAASGGSILATAMITMAFGEIMRNVMDNMRSISGGSDGLSFKIPEPFRDRTFFYYLCFAFLIVMFIVLRKFVNSPTGRILQGIRENEQRAVFLGFNTNKARTIALIVAGVAAGLAGIMYGLLTRFVNTDGMSMQMTYNAMLYSLIGGTGTLYGAIIGSSVVIIFQNILLDLNVDRWLLYFGLLYIVVIMVMPKGIAGFIDSMSKKRREKQTNKPQ